MTRLISVLLALWRKLLSTRLVTGSIKRLLVLFGFIRRFFSKEILSTGKDSIQPYNPPQQKDVYTTTVPMDSAVCASLQPNSSQRSVDLNSLHVPNEHDNDGPQTTLHSPTPYKGYLSPFHPYTNNASRSSQEISSNARGGGHPDTYSISTNQSANLLPSSSNPLPISHHGLVRHGQPSTSQLSLRPASINSLAQRPSSRNSQRSISGAIKLSREPSPLPPLPANTAAPAGAIAYPQDDYSDSRPSSPEQYRLLLPMSTATVQRWTRNIKVSNEETYCLVDPLKFSFDNLPTPAGWIIQTHPDGARYFFHREKKIYTDADLYDPEDCQIINESADLILSQLKQMADEENIGLPPDFELVLEIVELDDEKICGYYFVDHFSRKLFWIQEFDADSICSDIRTVVSISHLGIQIEAQYWMHYELFPNNREVTVDLVNEARRYILHATADVMTSKTSTAIWDRERNKDFLLVLDSMKLTPGEPNGYDAFIIGRMIRNIVHNQFLNLSGQKGARLDADQSVHGIKVNVRTNLIKAIAPFLFWAPDIHLESLEKIWVDNIIHATHWIEFITKLNSEWQEFVIIDTVLLNANMAFLAIQSVDNGGNPAVHRSAAQICSYISIVTSLGSVILSLLLVRQNRSKRRNASEASLFLSNMTDSSRGLETLAILYALPYALLMWSTFAFLAAFLFTVFHSSDVQTRVPVGAFLLAVGVLVIWCILNYWIHGEGPQKQLFEFIPQWDFKFWHHFKGRIPDENGDHERKPSGESATYRGDSPTGQGPTVLDEKPKNKRQSSWLPSFTLRKPTADMLADTNEKGVEGV